MNPLHAFMRKVREYRAIRSYLDHRQKVKFFRALPEVEQSYRRSTECRRLHRRGASKAMSDAYRATNAALGVPGMRKV